MTFLRIFLLQILSLGSVLTSGPLPLVAQKNQLAEAPSPKIDPLSAAAPVRICSKPVKEGVAYQVELSGLGLGTIVKLFHIQKNWMSGQMISSYLTNPADHAISMVNAQGLEFFYLDASNPQKWKVLGFPKGEPVPFSEQTFQKLYLIFEFLERPDLKTGDELFVTYLHPTDREQPFRSILLVAGETGFDRPHSDRKQKYLVRKFRLQYFETKKELDRKELVRPKLSASGMYFLDSQLRGAFKIDVSIERFGQDFHLKLDPKLGIASKK